MAQYRSKARGVVSLDNIGNTIIESLAEYTDEIAEGVHKAVDIVAAEVMEEVKSHVTFGIGNYRNSLAIKDSYKSKYENRKTLHLKKPYYTLGHLLEYGHRTTNGGMTRKFPHMVYGAELANRKLPIYIEKVIKGEKI
jgi:hypothetical protein